MSTHRDASASSMSPGQGAGMPPSGMPGRAGASVEGPPDAARPQGFAEQAKAKGQEAADAVGQATSQGLDKAATAAEELAGTLRERAASLPGDKPTELAYQASRGLEYSANFLREADFDAMRSDLEAMIRKHPVQSIAVGLAAGFLLARLFR